MKTLQKAQPNWVTPYLTRDGGFLDIGAHVGTWARAALDAMPQGRVLMVEPRPSPEILALAERDRVTYVQAVVGRTAGDVSFWSRGDQSSCLQAAAPDGSPVSTVSMVTIDAILPEWSVQALKMDVQGMELAALDGATRALREIPVWVIEAWPRGLHCAGGSALELYDRMTEAGFTIWSGSPVTRESVRIWDSGEVSRPMYADWRCTRDA